MSTDESADGPSSGLPAKLDDEKPISQQVAKWLKGLLPSRKSEALGGTIAEILSENGDGGTLAQERQLIANVLEFHDTTALDVMVPRADIISVDIETELSALCELFISSGHSRLPVYRETLDDVLGFVHIKDVMAAVLQRDDHFDLTATIRPVLVVVPSMPVADLLLDMRVGRRHMALVVDEYGGIDGLITIEDVVEELVGDINDEYDRAQAAATEIAADGSVVLDARYMLDEMENRVGPFLSEDEREQIDTVGGLAAFIAGRVPARGELLSHDSGLEFEVLDADPRRIKRLRLVLPAGRHWPSSELSDVA